MRFRTVLFLSTFYMLCFTLAAWSTPVHSQPSSLLAPAAETQSVIGKISSVGDAEFALDIVQDRKPNTLHFLVDGDTKVEGKLSVGSQASVDYRMAEGKMIATRVIVTPESGVRPH